MKKIIHLMTLFMLIFALALPVSANSTEKKAIVGGYAAEVESGQIAPLSQSFALQKAGLLPGELTAVGLYPASCVNFKDIYAGGKSTYTVKKYNGALGIQVQLLSFQKQPLASATGRFNSASSGTLLLDKGVKDQRYFYYRARGIYKNGFYGSWSAKKAFSTLHASGQFYTKSQKITIKLPSLAGIRNFEVWTSITSAKKGFKKVGNYGQGKSLSCTYVNGKKISSLPKGKTIYVYIRPVLVDGTTVNWTPSARYIYFKK